MKSLLILTFPYLHEHVQLKQESCQLHDLLREILLSGPSAGSQRENILSDKVTFFA